MPDRTRRTMRCLRERCYGRMYSAGRVTVSRLSGRRGPSSGNLPTTVLRYPARRGYFNSRLRCAFDRMGDYLVFREEYSVSYGTRRDDSDDEELGSLAQSARRTSLKQARAILIVVGVLNLLVSIFFFLNVRNEAKEAIEAEKRKLGPGMVVDQEKAREAEELVVRIGRAIYGGTILLSIIFIALGIAVYRAPVACTVTGLVLYLAGNAVFAVLDPMNLLRGVLIKIIIVVAMVKAVQAALAYEREVKVERAARRGDYESGGHQEPLPL